MSNDPSGLDRRLWRPASEVSDAGPARWDGAAVGEDVTLEVWVGPKNGVGARYFRCYLRSDLGRTREPVVFGMQNAGPYPGYNWVEVIDYHAVVALESGQEVEVPGGIERLIFEQFAKLVPPGGHLMAEYDSEARRVTAQALAARVPPIATPLGALMAAVGCGDAFKDWYISEGGREGPRKLQGFRALDEDHARRRGLEMLAALRAFLASPADLDWNLQARTRPLAQAAVERLQARFE
ncbi:MAG: DUF1122 family protein [Dehalococcoidia bacterium]